MGLEVESWSFNVDVRIMAGDPLATDVFKRNLFC